MNVKMNKLGLILRTVIVLCILNILMVLMIGSAALIEAQTAIVEIEGDTLSVGGNSSVDIWVKNIPSGSYGLGAYQIEITYDPLQVQITIVSDGDTPFNAPEYSIYNNSVKISDYHSETGPTGDIRIAAIGFNCVGPGTSTLGITVDVLADVNGDTINHTTVNATITQIGSSTPTSTPVITPIPTPIPTNTPTPLPTSALPTVTQTPNPVNSGNTSCFIATASSGDPDHDGRVLTLRKFRDDCLITNELGNDLVAAYYKASPPVADFIDSNPSLKPLVRGGLTPAVVISMTSLYISLPVKIVIVSAVVLISIITIIVIRRNRLKMKL